MNNPLVRRLELFTRLSSADKEAIVRASGEHVRLFNAHEDIIREGDRAKDVNLILSGWACRYKLLEDGRRQIIAFFVPGDLCDLNIFILKEMDHSIGTITAVRLAELSRETLETLTLGHPRVTQALWWHTLVTAAIQREWTISLGQRTALERMAHLFCEMFLRLRAVGLTQGNSCELPLTQGELGEATGLSTVHVNRTLQELRALGQIVLRGKTLTIPDLDLLRTTAAFNPNYLHFDREGAHLDANE